MKLYKFRWDCGRMGSVGGIFAATQDEVDAAIGSDVYLGEVLGKHSEVCGVLKEEDLKVLTDDESFIAKAIEYKIIPIGYNPLNYIQDEESEDE
jgi:hypothetical protein